MRLTQEEWQKRKEEVMLASETCRTVDEIVEVTKIEKNQMQSLYKKFPEEAKLIKANLKENKKKKERIHKEEPCIIMIDTCIQQVQNFSYLLEGFVEKGNRLGISDLVLDELCNGKKYIEAVPVISKLLHLIKDNMKYFEYYAIKENKRETATPDQTIIEACKVSPNIKLLTADNDMYIRATLQGVKAIYAPTKSSRIGGINKFTFGKNKKQRNNEVIISNVFLDNGQVVYLNSNSATQYTKVFSKTGKEKRGILVYLEEGDRIYSCCKEKNYLLFSDVEFYNQGLDEGIKKYQMKISDTKNLTMILKSKYKNFIKQADKILN